MYPGGLRIGQDEEQAVLNVLRAKRLFRYYGPEPGPSRVDELEKAFSEFIGTKHGLAVSSGTAALICALIGLGIGPGDEVIVPAFTWIATASAVLAVGAVPVLAEVDDSLTLDPLDAERKITQYTRAIIPVHMRGAPCQMDKIVEIAKKYELKILEDTAQANGASFRGQRLGSIGDAGAFSFQFNKIITCGEGGMMTTDDDTVFNRAVMYHDVVGGIRNQIPEEKILPGINFRMPELLAAVALVQLARIEALLSDMRHRKQIFKSNLSGLVKGKGIQFRVIHDEQGEAAIALIMFMPEAKIAQAVSEALESEGLETWLLYSPQAVDYHVYAHWSPVINQRSWHAEAGPWRSHPREIRYTREMCPHTLDLLSRAVHLDISPELSNTNIEEMTEAVYKVLNALA
jgi:dTDP-4-amino-4,6-dideoxygalactose transaminase